MVSMDPNPYEVTEPEPLRGLMLSWRGGLACWPAHGGHTTGSNWPTLLALADDDHRERAIRAGQGERVPRPHHGRRQRKRFRQGRRECFHSRFPFWARRTG